MTIESECRDWWNERFPEAAPLGCLVRDVYPQRWLRIHSLPEPKRYAEDEQEYAELLSRHNRVATDILGQGARCYLIHGFIMRPETHYDGWTVVTLTSLGQSGGISSLTDLAPAVVRSEFEYGPDLTRWQFEVSSLIWKPDQYNDRLRDVADWIEANILFVSQDTGRLYAPYDGGADLILLDEQERDEQKQAYREWLSIHPSGS